jgi:hypothetical protein
LFLYIYNTNIFNISKLSTYISVFEVLDPWIYINWEYEQLVCKPCRQAIAGDIAVHLRDEHHVQEWDSVQRFTNKLVWSREKIMPDDGSAPQPHINIMNKFKCREFNCMFISDEVASTRVEEHWRVTSHTGVEMARVQTWYGENGGAGWRVDENQGGLVPNGSDRPVEKAAIESIRIQQPTQVLGEISFELWHEDPTEGEREDELVGVTPAWQTRAAEEKAKDVEPYKGIQVDIKQDEEWDFTDSDTDGYIMV